MYRIIIKSLIIALFVFIIGLPLVLMTLGLTENGSLSYEQTFTLEAPTVERVLSGEFRDSFENWLSHSYPFRRDVLLAYNQLEYAVEAFGSGGFADVADVPAEDTGAVTDVLQSEAVTTEEIPEETPYLDTNPMYADVNRKRYERVLTELSGYKGTNTVIIGKSGYLYENGYINEYYGYSKMYREVTRERIIEQVERFEYIQDELAKRGIAFIFVITPSKASQYSEAIPDWYKKQNVAPDDYVRPYTYLVEELKNSTVNYIDSASLYVEAGLQETFPKTGTHWNKLASFETMKAILRSYVEQTGEDIILLDAAKVIATKDPPGYGNPEKDIYGAVYSAIPSSINIVDDEYYQPDVYVLNPDEQNKINVFLQGGSFAHDFTYYFEHYGIASRITRVYYNQLKMTDNQWRNTLKRTDYIVMECNEQFVRSLGGNAPYWAADKAGYDIGYDIIQSLYDYLKAHEGDMQ